MKHLLVHWSFLSWGRHLWNIVLVKAYKWRNGSFSSSFRQIPCVVCFSFHPSQGGLFASNKNSLKLNYLNKKCSQSPFKRNLTKGTVCAHAVMCTHAHTHRHLASGFLDHSFCYILASADVSVNYLVFLFSYINMSHGACM